MIGSCRSVDATETCHHIYLGSHDLQQPEQRQQQQNLPSAPVTNKVSSSRGNGKNVESTRRHSIVFEQEFEHEESQQQQQHIIIDVTSICDEELDSIPPPRRRDSQPVSIQNGTTGTNLMKLCKDSIHDSPTSVKDFSNHQYHHHLHQIHPEEPRDSSYPDESGSYDASSEKIKPKKRSCRWGKMIEEADWALLYKSLMRCKLQGIVVSDDMIIDSERNTTVLHLAAQKAPTALILLILEVVMTGRGTAAGTIQNYCLCGNNDGNTPLHICCANLERTVMRDSREVTIDFSVIKNLLVLGPEALVMQNKSGDTPLHLLLASNSLQRPDDPAAAKHAVASAVEAIAAIVSMEKDIALKQNVNGLTPLHVAIANHCPKNVLLQLFLMVPKAATITDNDGMNSMHYVASFGVQSWSFVEQLVAAYPEILYQPTIHGDTPLHLLVANTSLAYFPGMTQALSKVLTYNNSRHAMKLLTVLSHESGENQPISVQNAHGDTPLHFCAKMNAPTLLTQALMESHHAPTASTVTAEIDMTPLRIAMSTLYRLGDSHDAVGLRNAMCNVVALAIPESCGIVDSQGLTPLMHAVQSKKWSCWLVKVILQADPECAKQTTPDGLLALHYACQNKKLKSATLRDLINAYPSSIKALTNDRNTPLHYAAIQGAESVMQLLIKKYPKAVAQRNADGEWPIDLAIKHGVDPNVLEVFELSTSVPKKRKKGKVSRDQSSEAS